MLQNLLLDPSCREKCDTCEPSRLHRILALRPAIDDILVAHLPFLKAVRFLLDQLAQAQEHRQVAALSSRRPRILEQVLLYILFRAFKEALVLLAVFPASPFYLPFKQQCPSSS